MSEIQDNEILADCAWFANKHRAFTGMNRHERRKQEAIARSAGKK